jgi:hypothetical protein
MDGRRTEVKSADYANPVALRLLERTRRLMVGTELGHVATVASNLLLDVVVMTVSAPTIEDKEAMIDELAAALKTALRAGMECDGKVQ